MKLHEWYTTENVQGIVFLCHIIRDTRSVESWQILPRGQPGRDSDEEFVVDACDLHIICGRWNVVSGASKMRFNDVRHVVACPWP